jgi:hypothetical protein
VIHDDPHHTVQAFIDLIQRHEQSFYYFVHKVHSKGEGLFSSLMQWIEMFITVVREGLGDPLSLEFLLPHTGKERTDILSEVDKVAMHHYKLKVVYEDKLRRRFGNAQGQQDEDEATKTLVNGVIGDINFGDLAGGDAWDIAAEETDEDDGDDAGYTSSDYLTGDEDSIESRSTESGETATSGASASAHSTPLAHPHPLRQSHHHKAASEATTPKTGDPRLHGLSRNPTAAASTSSVTSVPALPARKRALSLRHMKSLTSLGSRKQNTEIVPPVPPMPKTPQSAPPIDPFPSSSSKPLLPSSSQPVSTNSQNNSQQRPNKVVEKKKRKKESLIKPPELVHIPQLLPVFVELVSFNPMSCYLLVGFLQLFFCRCALHCKLDGSTPSKLTPDKRNSYSLIFKRHFL